MEENFEKINQQKKQESSPLKEELTGIILSNSEKGLNKNILEESEKLLGNKNKLKELISDLLIDEIIIRQKKINSQEQNLEKIKNDILLETNKTITFYIENYENFSKCKEIFSNAKNLEEILKMKEPLIEIAKKIGLYDGRNSLEAQNNNKNKEDEGKTLFKHPSLEIFKLILNRDDIIKEREELHSINKSDGIYLPNDSDPDGGDAWEVEKTDKKETYTIIDTFGHGLSHSYAKLFIKKIISMLGNEDKDLFKVDDFLLEIDTAADFQFQLNTTMIRVEIEGDNVSVMSSGDPVIIIHNPEKDEVSVSGLSLMNYPGTKDIQLKKTHTIGAGLNTPPSRFTTSIGKNHSIIISSDSGLKEHRNNVLVQKTIRDFLNEQKGKNQKATDLVKRIGDLIGNKNFTKDDDITILKVR